MGVIDYIWLGLTTIVVIAGLVNLFVMGRNITKKIVKNAKFRYDSELAKRFVSDFKLPISVVYPQHVFMHQLELYEDEYDSETWWNALWTMIDDAYDGSASKFLKDYYDVRDKIITDTMENPAYKAFTQMDMKQYAFERPKVSKNNVYNGENIGKKFLSVDLSKANFQALRYVNPDIVLGAETYKDFISKFTNLDYVAMSKYSRQVIFGKLNVDRQITVEKYLINKIYELLKSDQIDLTYGARDLLYGMTLVSMSNDELIFDVSNINDDVRIDSVMYSIEDIVKRELNLDVHTEYYTLKGWQLTSPTNKQVCQTFFEKIDLLHYDVENRGKLVCVPLPFHNIIYKLHHKQDLVYDDQYFIYEKMLCRFTDRFELNELKKGDKNNGKEEKREE